VAHTHGTGDGTEPDRRDVLFLATGAMGAVGVAATVWPLIDQMNPSASERALSSIDVDVSAIEVGQQVTVTFLKSPVFIRRLTDDEKSANSGRFVYGRRHAEARIRGNTDGKYSTGPLRAQARRCHLG